MWYSLSIRMVLNKFGMFLVCRYPLSVTSDLRCRCYAIFNARIGVGMGFSQWLGFGFSVFRYNSFIKSSFFGDFWLWTNSFSFCKKCFLKPKISRIRLMSKHTENMMLTEKQWNKINLSYRKSSNRLSVTFQSLKCNVLSLKCYVDNF